MAQTNVNIRMDSEVKKQAEELFSDLGMNMTTAINIFVKQAIRTGGIPFQITREDSLYTEANLRQLKESLEQVEWGDILLRTMGELEEMAGE